MFFRIRTHITALLALSTASAFADLKLPSIFSDHMVLQRGVEVPVWGWADPNAEVSVSFASQNVSAVANQQGRWELKLKPLKVDKKPSSLEVSTSAGDTKTINDILVGEVWLASGQSNMEWEPRQSRKEDLKAVRKETVPQLRLFAIPRKAEYTNQNDLSAKWTESTPNEAEKFSAVAWFFAKRLHDELDVPVGIIRSAWGGSHIEPWITDESFQSAKALEKLYVTRRSQLPGTEEYAQAQTKYLEHLKQWEAQAKKAIEERAVVPKVPAQPSTLVTGRRTYGLYQAMIHPIAPFALKGFIWYQGESNNGDGMLYLEKKKALIGGWRKVFNNPKAPFYYVQIAPYNYGRRGNLPQLQFAQQQCLYQIPHTGMVVSNDVSNIRDIHPRNKSAIGHRLARWALVKDYGKEMIYSGPLYKDYKLEENKIVIRFDAADGLKTRDGKPATHFEIADDSNKWFPAAVKIVNGTVVLSSDKVKKPSRARFAWNQVAEPNLCNAAGLPASCFHTHWPEKAE